MLFAPQAALANPGGLCGTQTTDGLPGTSDTITCDPTEDYPDGIVYTSDGDLTLEVTPDVEDLVMDVGETGIDVSNGGAGDNLFWDSSVFDRDDRSDDSRITGTGIVLDYLSDTGNVDILVGGDIFGTDDATHAIRAESIGGGDVSVTTRGQANSFFGSGIGIEARTTTGAITLDTVGVSAGENGTHGILADSDSGDITMNVGSAGNGQAMADRRAIEAVSGGGNIDITGGASTVSGATGDRTPNAVDSFGIVAETSGAGTVTLNLQSATGTGPNGAAVHVTNGTGDVSIRFADGVRGGSNSSSIGTQLASGMVIDSGGDIVIEGDGDDGIDGGASRFPGAMLIGGVHDGGLDLDDDGEADMQVDERSPAIVASGQTFTLTLKGDLDVDSADIMRYRASLGGVVNNSALAFGFGSTGRVESVAGPGNLRTGGHVDLSGVTDGATLNFTDRSRWTVTDTSLLSPGDDTVAFDANSILVTAITDGDVADNREEENPDVDQTFVVPGEIDFGDGDDILINRGQLLIGPAFSRSNSPTPGGPDLPPTGGRFSIRGELHLFDLERLENHGTVWLGPMFFRDGGTPTGPHRPDGWHDDMLYAPGATFHGEEGSVVRMDVDLNQTVQDSCSPATRNELGYLPAADCIGLGADPDRGIAGGAATGRTELRILELIPGDRGSYSPDGLVLVDLAGGDPEATDPGAFVISPDTLRYADLGPNGSIDKGLFLYALAFDSELQQFRLYGVPSTGGQQFPMLATAANQLWRTATDGWFERRVSQRDVQREAGLGTGAWFNVSRDGVERDITTLIEVGNTPDFVFDNDYEQDDTTVSFGWDLIAHDVGPGSWVAGGMVGYARSEIDFNASGNSANLEGMHAGVYGGYTVGDFFVDAALNGTWVTLHNDVPSMDLEPEGTLLDTDIESRGLQLEAGWRLRLGALSVEPLLGYSMVSTDFDDMNVPADDPTRFGGTVKMDDSESRRASAGVRLALEDLFSRDYPVGVNLTARAIEEFDGESRISIVNTGPLDTPSADKFDETLFQLTGGLSVTNAPKTLNGYLNVDATTGEDYDSLGVSAGFRYQW